MNEELIAGYNVANICRRVAHLSPEQLKKKRAIDRDNQRYCRAKNKAYIKSLEARISDLTKRLTEAELRIRQFELNATQPSQGIPETTHHSGKAGGLEDSNGCGSLDDLPLDFGAGITIQTLNSAREFNFLDLGLSGPLDLNTAMAPGVGDSSDDTKGDNQSIATPVAVNHAGDSEIDDNIPEWKIAPKNFAPTNRLDEFIIDTTRAWRACSSDKGPSHSELTEPLFPSISSLLNPETEADDDEGNAGSRSFAQKGPLASLVAAQVFRTPLQGIIERVAFMYTLSHLIRWLVCRTKETYEQMPASMRPTHLQRTVPHPAWIDTVRWPEVRDELIRRGDWDRFPEYRKLTGRGLSVNWPYIDAWAFLESADGQQIMLNPIFEAHIRNEENWTIDEECAKEFPFLREHCSLILC